MAKRHPKNIVTMSISKADAAALFFSKESLEARKRDSTSPLPRFIAWLRSQDARQLDMTQFKVGGPADDFVFLYYYESVRYKLRKDGVALVSCADADNLMEAEEREMQDIVDTILVDEICRAFSEALPAIGAKMGKAKFEDAEEEFHTRIMAGVMG